MTRKEYQRMDAVALQQAVASGQLNPLTILDLAISVIQEKNPAINAFVETTFDLAKAQTESIDSSAPFAGVPFGIKDLGLAVDGTGWRLGSAGYRGLRANFDSYLVEKLRKSGLLFVGKTNTPEFGYEPFTEPSAYGVTDNPLAPGFTAGGSSGGSAAAVAAGMVPMATASDGGGSIRIPASCCGLIGLKPSRGRISLGPIMGDGWSGAIVEGCISKSVRDTARYLDVFSGGEPGDPHWAPTPKVAYQNLIGRESPRLRIGWSVAHTTGGTVDPDCVAAVHQLAAHLENLGHEVSEVPLPYLPEDLLDTYFTLTMGEAWADLNEMSNYLGRKVRPGDVEGNTYALYLLGRQLSAGEFAAARRRWNLITRRVAAVYRSSRNPTGIDLLLTPTLATPPFPHGTLKSTKAVERLLWLGNRTGITRFFRETARKLGGRIWNFIPWTPLANVTGQPSISLPTYRTAAGLPVGTLLTASLYREDQLLALAAELESQGMLQPARPGAESGSD